MLAAPQPDNHHRCGFSVFYKNEFISIQQLPEVPVFVDLIISLHALIFSETFSDVERILVRPRHLVWTVNGPPRKTYLKVPGPQRRYKYITPIKERFYRDLINRNIQLQPIFVNTENYFIYLIGYNLVKMSLGKFYGVPIDREALHEENLLLVEKLRKRGKEINYGKSLIESRFGIRIN